MLESDFRIYLRNVRSHKEKTISNRLANCRRVEHYEGDLDGHFDNDQCQNLLYRLTYSTDDQDRKRQPKHDVPIDGNLRNGTATLKQAVGLYTEFRRNTG